MRGIREDWKWQSSICWSSDIFSSAISDLYSPDNDNYLRSPCHPHRRAYSSDNRSTNMLDIERMSLDIPSRSLTRCGHIKEQILHEIRVHQAANKLWRGRTLGVLACPLAPDITADSCKKLSLARPTSLWLVRLVSASSIYLALRRTETCISKANGKLFETAFCPSRPFFLSNTSRGLGAQQMKHSTMSYNNVDWFIEAAIRSGGLLFCETATINTSSIILPDNCAPWPIASSTVYTCSATAITTVYDGIQL